MRRLSCFIIYVLATVSPMFAGGGGTGDGDSDKETCFWTQLPVCKPSDQLPITPCAKIEKRSDEDMATIRYLRKEDDVRMRESKDKDKDVKQYCCESSSFWHNLDIWMKTDKYRQASESKVVCEDQLVENQAFASRKVKDMNKQRFMGMCVWLVEKKKSKHKGKKMKELMMANGVGSVCPVRFTMMSPTIDSESVGVCHYMLFNHPQRLFNSHKDMCGDNYAQLAARHVKNTDGLNSTTLKKEGTEEVKQVESLKCIFAPLDECTEDVPPLPCWIKPKAWPRKYKSTKMQEKIRVTKFLKNKPDYRERNTDNEICCLRTSFWELLDKFAATKVYMKSNFREPCIDILKLDQLDRPIKDFASAQFYSFCVITHEFNESQRHKSRFLGELLRLRYDATCSMWSYKKEIANDRALCEFMKIKYHKADAETHWSKTHGDHCKVNEIDSESLSLGKTELDKDVVPEKQPQHQHPSHHSQHHPPNHHLPPSPPHNPHHPPHSPSHHLHQKPNHHHPHGNGHHGQHQPHHPGGNHQHHGPPQRQHHAQPPQHAPPPQRHHQPHHAQHDAHQHARHHPQHHHAQG